MREGLGKVADLPLELRIVFLGEEPDIVAQREQALEQLARLVHPILQRVIVGEPEAAGEEGALAGRKPRMGIISRLASSSGLPKLWVKALRLVLKPCRQTLTWISSRSFRQRSSGASSL